MEFVLEVFDASAFAYVKRSKIHRAKVVNKFVLKFDFQIFLHLYAFLDCRNLLSEFEGLPLLRSKKFSSLLSLL